ncbi:MAG: TetR/AcrR family transcriptional regulator [Bosea sp. (in: a-proteobacteria)]
MTSSSVTKPKRRGRPRAFDQGVALNAAMRLFWQRGFEGVSISELSQAMGINAPSLYATFGDKRQLFEASVEAYLAGHGCYAIEAILQEGTARAAIERLLVSAAAYLTDPRMPSGCMVVLSAINCAEQDTDLRDTMAAKRNASADAIRDRIRAGVAKGETPRGFNADAMAALVTATFQGLSIRARDGATREELESVARLLMQQWPEAKPSTQ